MRWTGVSGFKEESKSKAGGWANQTTIDRKNAADSVQSFAAALPRRGRSMNREPIWWSMCCGLDAVSCLAMTQGKSTDSSGKSIRTGMFAPVTRMGGKRAVADHVLQILGTWPQSWVMIDADPAIVEFWQAAFGGWLPAVAELIRAAPCDGEKLWKLWMSEPVPVHPLERVARWQVVQSGVHSGVPVHSDGSTWVRGKETKIGEGLWKYASSPTGDLHRDLLATRNERLARWIVGQKGNFSGKPLSWGEKWEGVAGFLEGGQWGGELVDKANAADRAEDFWNGVSGYASVSDSARRLGWKDRFQVALDADRLDDFQEGLLPGPGSALFLDLMASSPVFREGDLVTIDPPYLGTTGYGVGLTRERVVGLAEEAHECGCRVLVHEAQPVLTGGPWRAVELERRHGKKQDTFRKRAKGEDGEPKKVVETATINFERARTVSHTMAPTRTFSIPLDDSDEDQMGLFE